MKNGFLVIVFCLFGGLVFGQNLRTFTSNGLYGYKRGNSVAIPAQFSYAANFYNGRAAVLINNKWGYIDTVGTLVIPNDLDQAESFIRPYIYYYGKAGIGLMDTSGNKLTPAIFDGIFERYDGWDLNKGKMRGFYFSQSKVYLEPKYVELDFSEQFIVCHTGSTYDVLNRAGKTLASDLTKEPLMISYYQSAYCDISRGDSTFVMDVEGRPVTKSYAGISVQETSISFRDAETSGDYYDHLFLLHLPAPEDDYGYYGNEEKVSNRFHLFLNESHYYNEAVYSDYSYFDQKVLVKKDGVIHQISDNGEFVPTKYIGTTYFNGFVLMYLPDSTVDIMHYSADNDTLFVAHFYRVKIPFVERVNEYYNPEYTGSEETTYEQTYLAVLEVLGEGINAGKFAMYDLWEKVFITPFREEHFSVEYISPYKLTTSGKARNLCVLKNEKGAIGYSINNVLSDFEISSFEILYDRGILFKNDAGRRVFVPFTTDTVIELPPYTTVSISSMFSNGMESYVDPETGNEFWNESTNNFTFDFLVLTDASDWPKYGFMNSDYSVVQLPAFDRIIGSSDQGMYTQQYELIVTELNGLYGAYDLRRNIEIAPQYKTKLEFEFSSDYYFPYTRPDSLNYYLSSTGRKFHAKYNDGYPFKQKGKMGYISYDDFIQEGGTDTIIPPVYKAFEPLYDIPYHIAGNKSKKEGLLSIIGDTLLPLEYSDISWDEDYYSGYDQSGFWFVTTKNKKKGLYNAMSFTSIPAVYDDIEMQTFDSQVNVAVYKVTANGKCGVYDERLKLLAPCEYDGIDLLLDGEYLTATIQKGDKVGVFHSDWKAFDLGDSTCWYDYIVGPLGYRKTESGYDKYNAVSNTRIGSAEKIEFLQSDSVDYEVFEKEGLLGLRDRHSKKVLVKPTMRYIRMIDDSSFIRFESGITYYGLLYDKKAKYRMSQW